MVIALSAKNKLRFVTGKVKPAADTAMFNNWQHCNGMVISWVLNDMSGGFYSAYQTWTEHEDRPGRASGVKLHQHHMCSITEDASDSKLFHQNKGSLA